MGRKSDLENEVEEKEQERKEQEERADKEEGRADKWRDRAREFERDLEKRCKTDEAQKYLMKAVDPTDDAIGKLEDLIPAAFDVVHDCANLLGDATVPLSTDVLDQLKTKLHSAFCTLKDAKDASATLDCPGSIIEDYFNGLECDRIVRQKARKAAWLRKHRWARNVPSWLSDAADVIKP